MSAICQVNVGISPVGTIVCCPGVYGTIKDAETQLPLNGVKVSLSYNPGDTLETFSNESGFYSFHNIPVGLCSLNISKEEYITITTTVHLSCEFAVSNFILYSSKLKIQVSPDFDVTTHTLNNGDAYFFSITVTCGQERISNAKVYIQNPITGINNSIETSSNGECFYHDFIPKNRNDNTINEFKFTAEKGNYGTSDEVERSFINRNPFVGGNDETDALGICPTAIITGNGTQVINFSKEGRIVAYFTPSVGSWDIVPYKTSTEEDAIAMPLLGAPKHEGLFAGIEIDGMFVWLWQLNKPKITHPNDNDPTVKISYEVPLAEGSVLIDMICNTGNPESDPLVSVQSFNINNTTQIARKIYLVYYGQIHPIKINQQYLKYDCLNLDWNFGDSKNVKIEKNSNFLLINGNNDNDFQSIRLCATKNNSTIAEIIAAHAFGLIDENNVSGIFKPDSICFSNYNNQTSLIGKQGNWAVKYNLGVLNTGESTSINLIIASGQGDIQSFTNLLNVVNKGYQNFYNDASLWWENSSFIDKVDAISPDKLNEDEIKLLKRWILTCRMLVDNDSGAIIASPNVHPKYYPVWVRDAIFQSILWEALGETEIVDRSIDFLLNVSEDCQSLSIPQTTHRYWRQCYSILPPHNSLSITEPSNSRFQGIWALPNGIEILLPGLVEEDQMSEFIWGINLFKKQRGAFPSSVTFEDLSQVSNLIKSRINYSPLCGKIPGLLEPSFDWYEFPENNGTCIDIAASFYNSEKAGIGQSIVTNSAAIKALESYGILTGDQTFIEKSEMIKSSVVNNFFNPFSNLITNPPSYVQIYDDVDMLTPPLIILNPSCFDKTASTRTKLHTYSFASVWPFKVFNESNSFYNEYVTQVGTLFHDLSHNKVEKCFMPPYLMYCLYELYKNKNSARIDELVNQMKHWDIQYMPEVFYFDDDNGNKLMGKGASPLGWSNAWGALALLAKGGIYLNELKYDCPENFSICLNEGSRPLNGSYPNGIFSGPGVYDNIFNPENAGEGSHTITYSYVNPSTNEQEQCTFIITVKPVHELNLANNWSGISSYLNPKNTEIVEIFEPVVANLNILYNLNNNLYFPLQGILPTQPWDVHSGYVVKMLSGSMVDICGTPVNDKILEIPPGWNIIPVLNENGVSTSSVIGSNASIKIVKDVAGTGVYWEEFNINTLPSLYPGKAYFIYAIDSTTIDFSGSLKSTNITDIGFINHTPWVIPSKTPASHIFIFTSGSLSECKDGDQMGVFTEEGKCVGLAEIYRAKDNFCITAFGDDFMTDNVDGAEIGESLHFKVFRNSTNEIFDMMINFSNKSPNLDAFSFNGASVIEKANLRLSASFDNESDIQIFPNPTTGIFNIVGINSNTEIFVYDMFGSTVKLLSSSKDVSFDLTGQRAGCYLVKISDEQRVIFKKIILK